MFSYLCRHKLLPLHEHSCRHLHQLQCRVRPDERSLHQDHLQHQQLPHLFLSHNMPVLLPLLHPGQQRLLAYLRHLGCQLHQVLQQYPVLQLRHRLHPDDQRLQCHLLDQQLQHLRLKLNLLGLRHQLRPLCRQDFLQADVFGDQLRGVRLHHNLLVLQHWAQPGQQQLLRAPVFGRTDQHRHCHCSHLQHLQPGYWQM